MLIEIQAATEVEAALWKARLDAHSIPYRVRNELLPLHQHWGLAGTFSPLTGPTVFLIPHQCQPRLQALMDEMYAVHPHAVPAACPACAAPTQPAVLHCPACGLFLA